MKQKFLETNTGDMHDNETSDSFKDESSQQSEEVTNSMVDM